MSEHIVKGYDSDVAVMRLSCVEMAALALSQFEGAIRALLDADTSLAREVCLGDPEVDACQRRIDEQSLSLPARRQPMGAICA